MDTVRADADRVVDAIEKLIKKFESDLRVVVAAIEKLIKKFESDLRVPPPSVQ